jgi:hypothetical protein
MARAVSIDAGRILARLASGPATLPELAAECGADLRTVWQFVREFEQRGMLRRKPLRPREDLPRIERTGGCYQHAAGPDHSPNARRFEDGSCHTCP